MKNIFSKALLTGLVMFISQLTVAQISETTEETNPFSGSSSSAKTLAGDEVVRITAVDCKNCDFTSTEVGILKDVNPEITFKFDMTNWDGTEGEYILYSKATGGSEQIINSIYVSLSNATFVYFTYAETNFTGEVYAKFKNINGATSSKSNVYKIKIVEVDEEEESGGVSTGGSSGGNSRLYLNAATLNTQSINQGEIPQTLTGGSVSISNYDGSLDEVKYQWFKRSNNPERFGQIGTIFDPTDAEVIVGATSPTYSPGILPIGKTEFILKAYVNEDFNARFDEFYDRRDYEIVSVIEVEEVNEIKFSDVDRGAFAQIMIISVLSDIESEIELSENITYKWQRRTEANPAWIDFDTGVFEQYESFNYNVITGTSTGEIRLTSGTSTIDGFQYEGKQEYRRVLNRNGIISYSNIIDAADNLVKGIPQMEFTSEFNFTNNVISSSNASGNVTIGGDIIPSTSPNITYTYSWDIYINGEWVLFLKDGDNYTGTFLDDKKSYIPKQLGEVVRYRRRVWENQSFHDGYMIKIGGNLSNEITITN